MSAAVAKRAMSIFSCTALHNAPRSLSPLSALSDIDGFNIADVNLKDIGPFLLFGDQDLGIVANRIVSEATNFSIKASVKLN